MIRVAAPGQLWLDDYIQYIEIVTSVKMFDTYVTTVTTVSLDMESGAFNTFDDQSASKLNRIVLHDGEET